AVAEMAKGQGDLQNDAANLHKEDLAPLLEMRPQQRQADQVDKVLERLSELIRRFRETSENADRHPPFTDPSHEEFRLASRDYFRLRADYMELIRACLRDKAVWQPREDEEDELIKVQKRWFRIYRAVR